VEAAREQLSALLDRVRKEPRAHQARVEAARSALDLAFRTGDPHLADVAEALLADAPRRAPAPFAEQLAQLAAQAKATRRAVALAHRAARRDPHALMKSLIADPAEVLAELQRLLASGQRQIACAVLELARARHPGNAALAALCEQLHCGWPDDEGPEPAVVPGEERGAP